MSNGLWAWDVSALVYARTYGPLAHRLDDEIIAATKANFQGGVVIDCGCGPGVVTAKLAAAGPRLVVAVDVSQKMLDQVAPRDNVVTLRSVVEAGVLSKLRAEHAPEGFSLILFKRSLYHPHDQAVALLRDGYANLKPGGSIAIVHPEGSVRRYAFGEPMRLRSYTPYHLFNRTVSRLGVAIGGEHYTTPTREDLLALASEIDAGAEVSRIPLDQACFNLVLIRKPLAAS